MNESMIGHNLPPDMAATVGEVAKNLSDWMKDNPVITDETKAREAKTKIDLAYLAIADLEAERDALVRPLNTQVREINSKYRGPRELLERVSNELKYRITSFLGKVEAERIKKAEEARLAAERAEQAARNAERVERETITAAQAGVLDMEVMGAIAGADRAFAAYQKAERQAQIAERDTKVRIGGGITGRVMTLASLSPSKEIIIIADIAVAAVAMKDSPRLIEIMCKCAKSYKRVKGKYPPGIETTTERKA